jgi:hypothetical protein
MIGCRHIRSAKSAKHTPQDTARAQLPNGRVDPARVLWAGPLTLLVSVIAVICIRIIAVHILNPDSDLQPLRVGPPILDTVLFGGAAIYVFFRMCFNSLDDPTIRYRALAWKVLVVSFIPDVLVAIRHSWGGGWLETVALMTMHVAVWTLCVTMLPSLARGRRKRIVAAASN